VSETRRLKTYAAWKDRSHSKETVAMRQYESGGLGLHVPSRNTGRGVHNHGKLKGHRPECIGKPTSAQPASAGEARRLKRRGVMVVRLETRRSSLG
jgi:hypothetical protein